MKAAVYKYPHSDSARWMSVYLSSLSLVMCLEMTNDLVRKIIWMSSNVHMLMFHKFLQMQLNMHEFWVEKANKFLK